MAGRVNSDFPGRAMGEDGTVPGQCRRGVECGDWSPLSRGDWSPPDAGAAPFVRAGHRWRELNDVDDVVQGGGANQVAQWQGAVMAQGREAGKLRSDFRDCSLGIDAP